MQSERAVARTPTPLAQGSRGVANAALILTSAYILSRLLGLLRQTAINAQFGAGAQTDAFWAAFALPDFLYSLLVGGALTSAFIPVFARLGAEGRDADAWRVANTILNTAILVLLTVAALLFALAPRLAPIVANGFAPDTQQLTAQLTRILAIQPVYLGAGALAMAVLNARKHFLLPAYAPVVYNIGIILGAVLLAPFVGIEGLAVGVTLGSLGYFLLQIPGLRREGMRYRAELHWHLPEVREVGRLLIPRTLGLASSQIGGLITNVTLASALAAGSLTALRNATQIWLLPVGIFGVAVSTAAFPTLAEYAAAKDWPALEELTRRTLRFMLFVSVPSTIVLIVLRRPIVSLLLQHGRFNERDLQLTSAALLFYSLALWAHVIVELLPRVFYALHDTVTPLLINLVVVAVNVITSWLLMRWLALGGLALGLSVAATVEAAILLLVLQKRLPHLLTRAFAGEVSRILLAALPLLAALLLYRWITVHVHLPLNLLVQLGVVGVGAIVAATTYLTAASLLQCEDMAFVRSRAGRVLARFKRLSTGVR